MRTSLDKRFLIALVVAALPLATACEDPSNVGLGLVGGQAGAPVDTSAAVINMASEPFERPVDAPARVLVGDVDDQLLGRLAAEGYLDFVSTSGSDFRAGTVERAELRLLPSYVYGDTTGSVTVAIRSMPEDWETDNAPVDTSFDAGEVIREFTFQPTDTLVVVPMPETWVVEYDDTLRSETFGTGFHGFRLEHVSGNAVVGFGPTSTFMAAFTEDDSASFPVSRAYSGLERATPAEIPPNRALMQAGVGPGIEFDLDIDEEALAAQAVNRVALTFWADTLAIEQNQPPGFFRPQLTTVDLVGNTSDGGLIFLDRASLDGEGRFVFRSELLAREIQRTLIGTRSYESFELRVPAPTTVSQDQASLLYLSTSLNAMLLYDTGADEHIPVSYLTVTPIDG